MTVLREELARRWRQIFTLLAAGDNAPPGLLLRTEGMMEAVVLLGESSATQLQTAMDGEFSLVFKESISATYGDDWREFYAFPQIPAHGQRAPVRPSTKD